jgi:hypothetical protein
MIAQEQVALSLRRLSSAAGVAVVYADGAEQRPVAELLAQPGASALFEVQAGGLEAFARDPLPKAYMARGVAVIIVFESSDDALLFERQIAEIKGELQ